jgi:hypothetical protein
MKKPKKPTAATKTGPPPSATHFGLNLFGVVGALVALYVLRQRHVSGPDAVLIICAAGVLPIMALDVIVLRVHRRESTGLDWDKAPTPDTARIATKLLGLALTVGLIALAYWAFPEYGSWYGAFWNVLRRLWAPLVILAIAYVWFVDGHMRDPYDAYWQLGRVVLLRPSDAKRADVANHFRGWLVKGFYLPLFVVYTHGQLNGLLTFNLADLQYTNLRLYDFLNDLVYGLDVLFATVGYILSFRVIDTHLRTAEPTMLGWVVALECYQPFLGGPDPRVRRRVRRGHVRVRRALFQPHPPRNPYERPLSFQQAPGLPREEPVVVAHHVAVHPQPRMGRGGAKLRAPRRGQRHLLPASQDGGAPPLARPDLCPVRALDERARVAALLGPNPPFAVQAAGRVSGSLLWSLWDPGRGHFSDHSILLDRLNHA